MELELKDSYQERITVGNVESNFDITILAVNKEAHPESIDTIYPGAKLLILGEQEFFIDLATQMI